MIDPVVLASVTSAVSLLGHEFLKGIGGEAGKSTWAEIKHLLGWKTDPAAEEIPTKVATALMESPDLVERIVSLLKERNTGNPTAMVGSIEAKGGKVVVAQNIVTDSFQM